MDDHCSSESSRALLAHLFEQGLIRLERGPVFDESPSPPARPIPWAKVEGMLLGLAIGDGLGATTESLLPKDRQARYGELRDYIPNRYSNACRGFPTDDTQMAFWTLVTSPQFLYQAL